ncbi:hypothetical protein BJ165DRAFT_1595293 [Panaeolus papilionaceus]|nr:hypothetical protein BJ165DRAFT_1595293 [Panaeolus papilionaceus]
MVIVDVRRDIFGMLNSTMRGCEASGECGDWDCQKLGEFGGMCVDVKLERNRDGRDMVTFWKERGLKLEGTRMCEFDEPLKVLAIWLVSVETTQSGKACNGDVKGSDRERSGEVDAACNMTSAPQSIQVHDHYTGYVPAVLVLHVSVRAFSPTTSIISIQSVTPQPQLQLGSLSKRSELWVVLKSTPSGFGWSVVGDDSAPLEIVCLSFARLGNDEGV